ncbi:FAD:protein FMN transferase [Arenibacterium sp. CAU 1754]
MISRRRFLTISAAAAVTGSGAGANPPVRWRGHALGAEATLTIDAPESQARAALRLVQNELRQAETLYNLYAPASFLSKLNRDGVLTKAPQDFVDLLQLCDRVHHGTDGRFDPTVQPLWRALAEGRDIAGAGASVGWSRVRIGGELVQLAAGQALTLNGIAQGHVTDRITTRLRQAGLRQVLVNIGEYAAIGQGWTLGIADPAHGLVRQITLSDQAVATSSPAALHLGADQSHILDPQGQGTPLWSTVSVQADSAALADAASTAFCLMEAQDIRAALPRLEGLREILLVQADGQLRKITA